MHTNHFQPCRACTTRIVGESTIEYCAVCDNIARFLRTVADDRLEALLRRERPQLVQKLQQLPTSAEMKLATWRARRMADVSVAAECNLKTARKALEACGWDVDLAVAAIKWPDGGPYLLGTARCPKHTTGGGPCYCGGSVYRQPSDDDLPLMARESARRLSEELEWAVHEARGSTLPIPDEVHYQGRRYRIADVDEHGLPVVPRPKDAPRDMRYYNPQRRGAGRLILYASEWSPGVTAEEGWQRLEDFSEEPRS